MSSSDRGAQQPPTQPAHTDVDIQAETMMNLALLDPPRWGWAAVGGVVDLLPPQDRARRKAAKTSFLLGKKRQRIDRRNDSKLRSTTDSIDDAMDNNEPSCAPTINPCSVDRVAAAKRELSLSSTSLSTAFPSEPASAAVGQGSSAPVNSLAASGEQSCVNGSRQEGNASSETSRETPAEIEKTIEFKAYSEDGQLDIYAYHRGREGFEPRDTETGDLLWDLEPTDTNFHWDEPNLVATITVSFSLQDNLTMSFEDETDGIQQQVIAASDVAPMYQEDITWNLGDPATPTPMAFATDLAQEFGLSFGQTMDIAVSIQNQLEEFIRGNCSYHPPVALKDPNGNERSAMMPATFVQPYGQVLQTVPGGMAVARSHHRTRIGGPKQQHAAAATAVKTSTSSGRRKSSDEPSSSSRLLEVPGTDEPEPEDEFREEVRRRMQQLSTEDCREKWEGEEKFGSVFGAIQIKNNHICHICHKRHDIVGLFACRNNGHAYCKTHLDKRLGIAANAKPHPILEFCPICALSCECSKCQRRVEALSYDLRQRCRDQKTSPETVVFENMFTTHYKQQIKVKNSVDRRPPPSAYRGGTTEKRRAPIESGNNFVFPEPPPRKKINRSAPTRVEETCRQKVQKLPATEFPREVRDGVDVDAGYMADYLNQYIPQGSRLQPCKIERNMLREGEDISSIELSKGHRNTKGVVEDGNVDYCHVCGKHGNLLCCDFCPRAFHKSCIDASIRESAKSEKKWECHICCKEKREMPGDLIDGEETLRGICVAFHDVTVEDNNENLKYLKLLSMIHEMVLKLIKYDFGYMFRQPVDCDKVSGYRDSVTNPMDLGTIGSNLINGNYNNYFNKNKSWDDVVVAVLKDIELVWHNCFVFNYEGSAIYRVAEVHRRRMLSMKRKSFENLLSDKAKSLLDDYVKECERERGTFTPSNVTNRSQVRPDGRIRARHKISIVSSKKGCCRPVAVLDPDIGLIVKIYSTLKSAGQAADFLKGFDHPCEFSNLFEHTVKNIITKSKDDPELLLFGYRWLPLDELRKGSVKCSTKTDEPGKTESQSSQNEIVEMLDGESCYIFWSVDEAMSFPGLSNDVADEDLRKTLLGLSPGVEYASPSGVKWRRLSQSSAMADKENNGGIKDASEISLCDAWKSGDTVERDDYNWPPSMLFAKEDLLVRRRLVGFESIEGAFRDWLQTCDSSPVFPDDELKTMETFRAFYLDGDRNVDGIIWKTIEQETAVISTPQTECAQNETSDKVAIVSLDKLDDAKGPEQDRDHTQTTSEPETTERKILPSASTTDKFDCIPSNGHSERPWCTKEVSTSLDARHRDSHCCQEVDTCANGFDSTGDQGVVMRNGMGENNGVERRRKEDDMYNPSKTAATVS